MRARSGLKRYRIEACDLAQCLLQPCEYFHRTLREALRLIRVRPGQAIQPRNSLVDARIVVHGARSPRIHAEVDGIVPRREPGEMADHFHLADFRESIDARADVDSA